MKYPFEIGETIVINRIIKGKLECVVVTDVIEYYESGQDGINAVLYKHKGFETWEYFTNCRKLTKLDKALA